MDNLRKDIVTENNVLEGVPNILTVLKLKGISIVYDGMVKALGETPPVEFIRSVSEWLRIHNIREVYATYKLPG